MMGTNIFPILLKEIPPANRSAEGDIETIGKFILEVADIMQLRTLPHEDIMKTLFGMREFRGKKWVPTIGRIMRQMKKFITVTPNTHASYDWSLATNCLKEVFRNCLYFNKSLVGGNRNYY